MDRGILGDALNGLAKTLAVYAVAVLLLSCDNRVKPDYTPTVVEGHNDEPKVEEFPMDDLQEEQDQGLVSGSVSSLLSGEKPEEADNMRGFDPASEDDMEDGGVERYMENNDNDGWD